MIEFSNEYMQKILLLNIDAAKVEADEGFDVREIAVEWSVEDISQQIKKYLEDFLKSGVDNDR